MKTFKIGIRQTSPHLVAAFFHNALARDVHKALLISEGALAQRIVELLKDDKAEFFCNVCRESEVCLTLKYTHPTNGGGEVSVDTLYAIIDLQLAEQITTSIKDKGKASFIRVYGGCE